MAEAMVPLLDESFARQEKPARGLIVGQFELCEKKSPPEAGANDGLSRTAPRVGEFSTVQHSH